MKNLQLPLTKDWFDLTKSGEKPEDYREITPYFCNMFLLYNGVEVSRDIWERLLVYWSKKDILEDINITVKPFKNNIMTLGYPKKTDTEKILTLEHKGIEIGEGNPEWGAESGKLYFVIKHGKIL
jgi:hypothetical protein